MSSKEIGILGEKIAENYLRKKGYKILEKNYSPSFVTGLNIGEIDLITKKEDVIIFVEVKTLRLRSLQFDSGQAGQAFRKNQGEYFNPEDKVNYQKQRKIIKTAQSYILEKKLFSEIKWQVDVLSIVINFETRKAKIKHFKNAVV
ncbi:MAG: YraN family protein [Candidatus Nealsonbacteria bacterium]|nr:YraN family protein [Candidatus Nealsonbacteria bacterium]